MNLIEISFGVLTLLLITMIIIKGEGRGLNRKIVFDIKNLKPKDRKNVRVLLGLSSSLIFIGLIINAMIKQNDRHWTVTMTELLIVLIIIGTSVAVVRSKTK